MDVSFAKSHAVENLMLAQSEYSFGSYRLDTANARVLRGRQPVPLKPKAFDVLALLVQHAGRLVSQDDLIQAIWPDTIVGDSSLKSCIRQIRRALGDRVRNPQYIETVHRRGYRFIAPLTAESRPTLPTVPLPPSAADPVTPPVLVGRTFELTRLRDRLALADGGQRQVVFVTGGPGTGKTALVERFLHPGAEPDSMIRATGQCLEQFGSGEPYLPVLEALGRIGRGPHRERLARVLSTLAPTWLSRLPDLCPPDASPTACSPTPAFAPVPERMLREMAEALERLTADVPLVLVLEDLHWTDYSTLDLLSALARRRGPARLLLIATYRPVEAVLSGHPLRAVKQDLLARGLCHELPLGLLSQMAVDEYVASRFPGGGLPDGLSDHLYERTEGHPLFLSNLVDDWLDQGLLVPQADRWELTTDLDALVGGVPVSIRALIEKQLERLGREEMRVLEGASVAGVEFAVAAAATAVEEDLARAEEYCEAIARRHHFLQARGTTEWPDGTISTRYRFGHELYHRVVLEGVPEARRRLLHHRLAERLEAAHGDQSADGAAEMALHFSQGRDPGRAVRHFESAAHRAARQYAHREAIDSLRKGLALVDRLPGPDRVAAELRFQVNLGLHLQVTQGFASPPARRAYERARALCRLVDSGVLLFPVLWGLWLFHKVRSELPRAREMADELYGLADQLKDPALLLQAHQALAVTTLCAGEPKATCEHMQRGTSLYDPRRHHTHTFLFGQDPGVACQSFGAVALWLLGYPDQALAASRQAAGRGHELGQPSSQALALYFAAMVHQCRGDVPATRACAELALAIAADQGLSFWHAGATILRGWAIAQGGTGPEGIAMLQQGLDAWQATGSVTYRTYFLALLAEALGREGRTAEGLSMVQEALKLADQTSERLFEAELYRLRGELLRPSNPTEAEANYLSARAVAQKQEARSLELRAALSLTRLYRETKRAKKARPLLEPTLAEFTEGLDTRDLREARALLERVPV